jgi:glycosyltransferase involved in cell wall biosynthesis
MNILLLTHSYPDKTNSWRGSFIKEQANVLSLGNFVTVVFFKVDTEHFALLAPYSFSKTKIGNLTEYTVTIKRSLPFVNQLNFLFKTYKFIEKEILSHEKPDLIHSHLSYPAGFLGTIIQKRKKIPALLTEHSRITNYYRSWFHRQCIKYTFKNIKSIVAVSNSLKTEIVSLGDRPVIVIHNIVDAERFNLIKSHSEPIINIGFLGGLGNNNKGLDLLLKSVSFLEGNGFMLHIGGKGKLLDFYLKMAKDYGIETNCKFYGEIARDEIADFYAGLDVFVLPSRYETFGVVLIEAMACGIPVIATRCGGPEEIVTQSTGILIETENIAELTAALKYMSQNIKLYNKEVIRTYAKDNFGPQVFIEQISSLYKEIITNNSNE